MPLAPEIENIGYDDKYCRRYTEKFKQAVLADIKNRGNKTKASVAKKHGITGKIVQGFERCENRRVKK